MNESMTVYPSASVRKEDKQKNIEEAKERKRLYMIADIMERRKRIASQGSD